MGFGLLFIGYFTTYFASFNSFGFLMRLIGYVIMLISFNKLRKYNRAFLYPMIASIFMICGALFESVITLGDFLYRNLLIEGASDIYTFLSFQSILKVYFHIDSICILIFHALLLLAIRKISIDTESEKTAYAAARNLVFFAVYYLMTYIALLPFDFIDQYEKYFSLPVFLLYIVCLALNCILIFSCYAKICDENDVDMQIKESRFAFVNKLREKADKKEQAAADANTEYIKKKLEEKRNKKKGR